MKRITRSALMVNLLMLMGQSPATQPVFISDQAGSLEGIREMYVRVRTDDDSASILRDTSFKAEVQVAQNDAELQLRKLGIKIVDPSSSVVGLDISITVVKEPGHVCVYDILARFSRVAYLDQNGQKIFAPTTWEDSRFGASPLAEVYVHAPKELVNDLVNGFANDYLKANPPAQPQP